MLIEEANRLLKPGYMSTETGYFRLTEKQLHVRVLTRMPGCRGRMVDWWFGYLDGTEKYRLWEPHSHLSLDWDDHWRPGHYVGASYLAEERVGTAVLKTRTLFHDPFEFFDPSRVEKASAGAVICASAFDPEGMPRGRIIHYVRDTDYGCEMRSRFWLYASRDDVGMAVMMHCMKEMGRLADLLPDLYVGEKGERTAF